jgi:fibronectin-binding autotransporter adhesin
MQATGTGFVVIDGPGSSITDINAVEIGSAGTGTLTVSDGGAIESFTGWIGTFGGAAGEATITGSGSVWTLSGQLGVGNAGSGALAISDGGTVFGQTGVVVGRFVGSDGTLKLEGTAGSRGVLETSQVEAGDGTPMVEFDGGILRLTGNQFSLFDGFDAGEVDIGAGGAFIDTQGFYVGSNVSLGGTGGLTKLGTGTLELRNANTFEGGLTVLGGTFNFSADDRLGAASGGIGLDGGRVNYTGGADEEVDRAIVLADGGGTISSSLSPLALLGDISGTGGLTIDTDGDISLSGDNTYQGATNLDEGTLKIIGGTALPDTTRVTVDEFATLDVLASETIGSLAGNGAVSTSGTGAVRLTTGGDGTSTTFFGAVTDGAGTVGLTKVGAGTLTVTGTNTFSGGLAVNGGTLAFAGVESLGATDGGIAIDGGTLRLTVSGIEDIDHDLEIGAGGATIASHDISDITLSGDIGGEGGPSRSISHWTPEERSPRPSCGLPATTAMAARRTCSHRR